MFDLAVAARGYPSRERQAPGGSSPSKRYANEGILLHAIERKLGIKKLV